MPHTRGLWFQVRSHGSFGADLQCLTYYRNSPSPRGPWPSPGCRSWAWSGATRLLEGLYCGLFGVLLSTSTFSSFLSLLLSLLSLWLALCFLSFQKKMKIPSDIFQSGGWVLSTQNNTLCFPRSSHPVQSQGAYMVTKLFLIWLTEKSL